MIKSPLLVLSYFNLSDGAVPISKICIFLDIKVCAIEEYGIK